MSAIPAIISATTVHKYEKKTKLINTVKFFCVIYTLEANLIHDVLDLKCFLK